VICLGVGAMRKYCLGAFLLDLNDPTCVIGRLREPLLCPNASEREGYVPNAMYSCGSLLPERKLIIPLCDERFRHQLRHRAAGRAAGRNEVKNRR